MRRPDDLARKLAGLCLTCDDPRTRHKYCATCAEAHGDASRKAATMAFLERNPGYLADAQWARRHGVTIEQARIDRANRAKNQHKNDVKQLSAERWR